MSRGSEPAAGAGEGATVYWGVGSPKGSIAEGGENLGTHAVRAEQAARNNLGTRFLGIEKGKDVCGAFFFHSAPVCSLRAAAAVGPPSLPHLKGARAQAPLPGVGEQLRRW